MKKSIIIVVALVLALVLAGSAYIILSQRDNNNGDTVIDQTISIGISGYNEYNVANDIKKMTINNLYGTFSFTPDPTVNGIDDKSWFLDDLDGVKSDAYAVNDIALGFYSVIATKKLAVAPADLTTYGFDDPELTVTIEFNDGTVFSYSFGGSVGLSDSESDYYCYMMRSGDDAVYLVENYYYDIAFISLKDVMKTELYSQLESNAIIQEVSISGSEGDTLKIQNNVDNYLDYRIVEPYNRDVDSNAISDLLGELDIINEDVTVEIAGTKDMQISDYTLHMYGLDEPARILNFKYTIDDTSVGTDGNIVQTHEDGEHTIKMGIIYNNTVYVMVDDVNAIYAVPYSLLSAAYEASFDSLAERNIYTERLINIDEIVFDTDFKTFDYKLTSSTEVNSVTLNGKTIDVSAIKSLYTKFASIAYSERSDEKPAADPYMTITIKLNTGATDVIRFTEYNSRRYFVTINGEGDLLVSYELIDELMDALKATDKGSLG